MAARLVAAELAGGPVTAVRPVAAELRAVAVAGLSVAAAGARQAVAVDWAGAAEQPRVAALAVLQVASVLLALQVVVAVVVPARERV